MEIIYTFFSDTLNFFFNYALWIKGWFLFLEDSILLTNKLHLNPENRGTRNLHDCPSFIVVDDKSWLWSNLSYMSYRLSDIYMCLCICVCICICTFPPIFQLYRPTKKSHFYSKSHLQVYFMFQNLYDVKKIKINCENCVFVRIKIQVNVLSYSYRCIKCKNNSTQKDAFSHTTNMSSYIIMQSSVLFWELLCQ